MSGQAKTDFGNRPDGFYVLGTLGDENENPSVISGILGDENGNRPDDLYLSGILGDENANSSYS